MSSRDLIVVTSTNIARTLFEVLEECELQDAYTVFPLVGFKDFPTGDRLKDIGLNLDGDFSLLLDEDQSSLKRLKQEARKVDRVYLALSGDTSLYTMTILRNYIITHFPMKKILILKLSGLTPERLYIDLQNTDTVFNEVEYEQELALRSIDRISKYYINNKKPIKAMGLKFPGLFPYYVLLYIYKKRKGHYVRFSDREDTMSVYFSNKQEAETFIKDFDITKMKKSTANQRESFSFKRNHFFRDSTLLTGNKTIVDVVQGIWYLFGNGFITDPTEFTYLSDLDLRNIENYYNRVLTKDAINRNSYGNRGMYVTNLEIYPETVPEEVQDIYRVIWRTTLAAVSKSFRGTKYKCVYDGKYIGSYTHTIDVGYKRFTDTLNSNNERDYIALDKPRLFPSEVRIYDVMSHFGLRGYHALKVLMQNKLLAIDTENKLTPTCSADIQKVLLTAAYPELLKTITINKIYEEHGNITTAADRIEFLNKFLMDTDKQLKAITLPTCPECKNKNLHLVTGNTDMLICKTSAGGCGSVYSVRVTNNSLVPIKKDK